MDKRRIAWTFFLIGLFFASSSIAWAAGPATVYKNRISKFEMFNGATWITVFEGTSSALDIAGVSAGSSAGSFLSGLSVPDGAYTQVRVTPYPTFIISGNDGASYTTAAVGVLGGSTPGTAAQQAECTITLTGANLPTAQTKDFSATPITVTNGEPDHKVRVSFDVSAAIQLQGAPGSQELFPGPPVVSMTIQ